MNRCHPVGAVRTYDRQIGHTKLLGPGLTVFDNTHALNSALIARKPPPHIAQKTAIDLVDNLELPGQHVFKPGYRPLFESFGQQGVIGVRQRVLRDAVAATKDFQGLTGVLTCSTDGDCANPIIGVYTYHAGAYPPELIWPTKCLKK